MCCADNMAKEWNHRYLECHLTDGKYISHDILLAQVSPKDKIALQKRAKKLWERRANELHMQQIHNDAGDLDNIARDKPAHEKAVAKPMRETAALPDGASRDIHAPTIKGVANLLSSKYHLICAQFRSQMMLRARRRSCGTSLMRLVLMNVHVVKHRQSILVGVPFMLPWPLASLGPHPLAWENV